MVDIYSDLLLELRGLLTVTVEKSEFSEKTIDKSWKMM